MNDGANKSLMTYWDVMRGAVPASDYITATVLVNEVNKTIKNFSGPVDADESYNILLQAADNMSVRNPFFDKEHFYLVLRESQKLGHLDWEGAIAQVATATRMPIVPAPIVDLYKGRFSKKPESVLIAEAERFAPNLQSIVDENINSKFVLTTQNAVYAQAIKNVFDGYDNVEVLISDVYRYEFIDRRFDLIFSCPNFGGRTLAEDTSFMCREYDMVALENLSLHLNANGELVILLPGRITFASGKIADLRQFIQMSYRIKELSELPEGSLEYCGIKVYLLDIENSRPEDDDDIVIKRYVSGEKKTRRSAVTSLSVTEETFVMLSELMDQGDWSVDRIFSQQDEDYLKYQNSNIRKELIGNVAEIFRGKSVTKKDPSGGIGVVNISNIGEYDLDYDGLDHLDEEERKVSNYLLHEGDVLLPARGTAIRTAVFHEQRYPCIASSNVIVIRPDEKMLESTYLKIFLDSPIGNKLISGAQQGMVVMNISYKDLKVLEIPIPPIEKQKSVAKEYLDELKQYQESIAAAEQRWKNALNKLQEF